jgi:oligosaccharide repeat unit polymerase
LGLFAVNRVLISLIDAGSNFLDVFSGAIITSIDSRHGGLALVVYAIFILITNLFVSANLNQRNHTSFLINCDDRVETDDFLRKIGFYLMVIFFAFAFYRAILEFRILYGNRALLFLQGSANIGLPLYIRLSSVFFEVGFLLFVASFPSKKQFIRASIVYFLVILPNIIIGNRMQIASMTLYVLWFLGRFYGVKISKIKALVGVLLGIVLLQIIGIFRTGDSVSEISVSNLIMSFLSSQSNSFEILPLYTSYKDAMPPHVYPYLFDSMFGGLIGVTGQNYEVLLRRAGLGSHLTYTLNPNYYFAGGSIGTSYIAELYEFGLIGIVVGSVFLSFYIIQFQRYVGKSRFVLLFSYYFFYSIVSSPRASLLPAIYVFAKLLLVICIVLIGYNLIFRKKFSLYRFYV